MIADNREGPIETFLKLITAPDVAPLYFGYLGCRKVAEVGRRGRRSRRGPI